MINITTIGQTVLNADGSLANGTIDVALSQAFEYDGASGRIMVFPTKVTFIIKNGILVDSSGNATSYQLHPTVGANNSVLNNFYGTTWKMTGAQPTLQRWSIPAAAATIQLLDIILLDTPALPVIHAPGATGATGAQGAGIDHVSKTGGNGAPGTSDTYTLWGDVGETISMGTYTVSNGANGILQTGSLLASNNLSDVSNSQTSLNNIGGLGIASLIYGGGF